MKILFPLLLHQQTRASVCLKQILFKATIKNSFISFTFRNNSSKLIIDRLIHTVSVQCQEEEEGDEDGDSQQEVKVFQKKFLQPAFLSRGASSGPPAAAARSRSTRTSSGSPSPRGRFSSSRASFSTCRRSDRSSSASEDRDMS